MARKLPAFDISEVADELVTGEEMEQSVDEKTLFCTPAPLAASTAFREAAGRGQKPSAKDMKGSFLDDFSRLSMQPDMSRLSMQSESGLDLTNHLKQLNFSVDIPPAGGMAGAVGVSASDLIQFSKTTADLGSDDQDGDLNKSDASASNVSSRSSLGLIPLDMLDDCDDLLEPAAERELSASVLPLSTPKMEEKSRYKQMTQASEGSISSSARERTAAVGAGGDSADWADGSGSKHSTGRDGTRGDSTDWSDNSKQDSKDLPWGKSHLETVKKRPQPHQQQNSLDSIEESRGSARGGGGGGGGSARGAIALFAGHLLGDVQERDELDHSVHHIELGDDDLQQLDVEFSDLEEDRISGESGDEDFDFDEPMISLPGRGRVPSRAEEGDQDRKSLQAELAEAVAGGGRQERSLVGQESDDDADDDDDDATPIATRQNVGSNANDFGLDSHYFRQTSMTFAGDGEDTEVTSNRSNRSNSTSIQQQRGAAEGEHLLTKLRRQFMSGDGSENEIDTDDELEAARTSLAMASRERAQGADEEDGDRSELPLPVGLEDSSSRGKPSTKNSSEDPVPFSFKTRQSAEGNVSGSTSPTLWSGEDGAESESERDANGGVADNRPSERVVSGAAEDQAPGPVTSPSSKTPATGKAPATGKTPATGKAPATANSSAANSSALSVTATAHSSDKDQALRPEYFLPTSNSTLLHDSAVVSHQALDGSTFNMEDMLKGGKLNAGGGGGKGLDERGGQRPFAAGFNAEDDAENPFEDQFGGSLGSFGFGPEGDAGDSSNMAPEFLALSHDDPEEGLALPDFQYKPLSTSVAQDVNGNSKKGGSSFDGPFRKPKVPVPKAAERKDTFTLEKGKASKSAVFPGVDDDTKSDLENELRELGIDVGDDEFKPADSARAMLDAAEEEFEKENKFSEHHQLSVAASGLSWGSDESALSGFLGGEDRPENLEMSIGTYMAARTETLGTLGGDPAISRPEFGKPVHSPPPARFPVKIMSPPSNASSMLSMHSRTDGEGDEDGDQTLVSPDGSALQTSGATSPGNKTLNRSAETPQASPLALDDRNDSQNPALNLTGEEREPADISALKEELSSLILDLTAGGADLTMEDALSMSAITEFVKNHSFGRGAGFASAIMQLTQAKQGAGAAGKSKKGLLESGGGKPANKPSSKSSSSAKSDARTAAKKVDSDPTTKDNVLRKSQDKTPVSSAKSSNAKTTHLDKVALSLDSSSSSSAKSSPKAAPTSSSSPGGASPAHRASKLPVRAGANSSPQDKTRVGEVSSLSAQPLSKRKSQSVSQLHANGSFSKDGDGLRHSADDSALSRRRVNSQGLGDPKSKSWDDKPAADGGGKNVASQHRNTQNTHRARSKDSTQSSGVFSADDNSVMSWVGQGGDARKRASHADNLPGKQQYLPSQQSTMFTPPQKIPAGSSDVSKRISPDSSPVHGGKSALSAPGNNRQQHLDRTEMSGGGRKANSASVTRQAVGTDSGDWTKLRPFESMHETWNANNQPGNLTNCAPTATQTSSVSANQQQVKKPTLLTGASLLKTEFAQKYLLSKDSGKNARQGEADQWMMCTERTEDPTSERGPVGGSDVVNNQVGYSVGRDNREEDTFMASTCDRDVFLDRSRLETATVSNAQKQQPEHQFKIPSSTVKRKAQPPPQPPPALDDTAASQYYELGEDLGQTTFLGAEQSALGSFWGKSPLYQSTPAEPGNRMAAVGLTSQLEGWDLTTPNTGMATPRVQRRLVDLQRSVDFPHPCCLGVSQKTSLPVTNRTGYTVVCCFRLVMLQHDGKTVQLEQQSPFELKPKLSIAAGDTENLPVLFVPKRPGEYVCQVEVYAQSLNRTLESMSSLVQLRAVAEVPCIQISPSVEVIQMGEVAWGTCTSRTIKLRNVKKASLPVRLSIWSCGGSVWHCFTFDNNEKASDLSIISMSSRPESLRQHVVTVTLPGCSSPDMAETVEVVLYCRPPSKERNRALSQRPADKIEAKVDIEVDTPVQYLPPLASLVVQATIGMPHLRIDRSHMLLSFKTVPNKNIQLSIKVDNSGNISMTVDLSVTAFPECFRVSPTRLTIAPQNCADVAVTFSPFPDVNWYQSLLLMDLQPDGPSYEIPMEAAVLQPILKPTPLSILSSKSFLSFNGVPINQTKMQTLRFYNKDPVNAEYASVEVRQSHNCFQLLSEGGEWQQKCEMVLGPKEKVTLTVIFYPTDVRGYSGKLVIRKQSAHSSKYSIPLAGYGGCSAIEVSGACLTNSGHRWLEMGSLSIANNKMQEIVLTNSGVRAAFIRATAFYDMPCKQPAPLGRVGVEPNNFVLAAGSSMKVMVAISPSQREVDLVRDRKEVVAVVRFQHGDEVMRQKYLRAYSKGGTAEDDTEWQAAFRQPFTTHETASVEGHKVPESPDDCATFFHHLSSTTVALLGEASRRRGDDTSLSVSAVLANNAAGADTTTGAANLVPGGRRGSESLREDASQFMFPKTPRTDKEEWTIEPDHLSFTVGETSQELLQLINFSRQPLRFKLRWPKNSVMPEPSEGELLPRSSLSVEVWLHLAWQKRQTELPWKGEIVVSCAGLEKVVKVHIRNTTQPPRLSVSSPQSSPRSVSAGSALSSRDTTLSGTGRGLHLASDNIHFDQAVIGGQQESFLQLTNRCTEPVHWKIAAFVPPYVKGADGGSTVQRVGYEVFMVKVTGGDLLPEETVKVPVKFCPKTRGMFNQRWEIEHQPLTFDKVTPQDKVTTKVTFTADVKTEVNQSTPAVVKPPAAFFKEKLSGNSTAIVPREPRMESVSWDRTDTATPAGRTPLQEKHNNTNSSAARKSDSRPAPCLQLMNRDVTFTSTKVGQVTQLKIEFKNSLDYNIDLSVESPKPPFRIKHKSFKVTKMRFLKYPIEFGPSSPGTFKDVLVFKAPQLGKTFTAHLTGVGV